MGFDFNARKQTKVNDHPVAKLLNSLRMETGFFTHSTVTQPWGMKMPPMSNCMMFHLVLSGEAEFKLNQQSFRLTAGDFVLFPKGDGHIVSDGRCQLITPLALLPIKPVTERYETLNYGGGGVQTELACGVLLFQHPLAIKLMGILPEHIVITHQDKQAVTMVQGISDLLRAETERMDVGVDSVIARLADILVIAAMRQHLTQLPDEHISWLGALEDERIFQSLKLIHERPDKHWSLDELAVAIGMSRTGFAQQFKRLVGNTPMEYLTQWRMSMAYSKLQLTKDTQLAIALEIGYQSEAAFGRAFKKVMGKSPGEVRKAYLADVEP